MYPVNAVSISEVVSGVTETIIYDASLHNNKYNLVIGVSMQQEKDLSDTELLCDTELVALNYGKDLPQISMMYECDGILKIEKTGQDEAFVHVVMLYDDPIYTYSTTTSTSTQPSIINGFTHGEMINGLMLFLIIIMMFFGGIIKMTIGNKQKKTASNYIMGNNTEEGKTFYHD